MSDVTTPDTPQAPQPTPELRRRWRPRRLHWHLSIWTLVAAGLGALFLVFTSMSLTGRVVPLPPWVAMQVEQRINAALPEGTVSVRQVEFGVTPRGRPMLRFVDVGIRDATGLELGRLNGVEGGFKLGAALLGRIEPTILRLTGAQVTLRRLSDGTFALQLGQELGTAGNLATMLDTIDGLFTGGPLATTDRLEATDLTITLEDARSGRLWQVTDGRLEIMPGEKVVDTTISFDVFNGTEELATTEFSFRSARDSSEASLAARFDNAAAVDIAAQAPALAFLSVIDAPISGALRSTLDAGGAITDLAGTMQIGEGALSPTPGATPARFDGAKVYIDFDPAQQRLDFQGLSVISDLGTAQAEGQVFLSEFQGGWPGSLIGQITLNNARIDPEGMFQAPLTLDRGMADLRVRLDPFSIDIGQAVLYRGDRRYEVSGNLGAGRDGWSMALDGRFASADRNEVLALWPVRIQSGSRDWVAAHVETGEAFDGTLAWRKAPGERITMSGTFGLRDARVAVLEALPPVDLEIGYVTLAPGSFIAAADAATITAPDGSVMDLAGVSYRIPDTRAVQKEGIVNLAMNGPVPGALALLAEPPFSIFAHNSYGPDVARGQMAARGLIRFPLAKGPIPPDQLAFDLRATLSDVSSDQVVKGKLLVADTLSLRASDTGVEIDGPVRVGQAAISGSWRLPLVDGKAGATRIDGTVALTASSLREFGLGALEEMVSGATRARFSLDFAGDGDPALSLRSDLAGLAMTVPGTGWSKPAASTGTLEVEARLGDRPVVDRLVLEASGLSATGQVTTVEGGGLGEATFEKVRIGGWLDAPVVITGRGAGVPVAITVPGGTIDMRRADLDTGSGSAGKAAAGPRQPLTLALDRLIISEGIQIQNMRADLDLAGGLHGTFLGRVAGGGRIRGTVAQQENGAAFRITSPNAGGVLRGANIFQTARGGALELVLAPVGEVGTYEGEFKITDTRLVKAPAMAEMLSAISVVGLLDQLSGAGIGFSEVEGRFRLAPSAVTLYRSSAVSPSMGISLDGYYDMAAGQVDLQGVLSPFYLVNSIGRIFSPREGEGLVGFNFTLKGPFADPEVEINPLSILTPGAFREIFRRPPPTAPQE
jgi:AsmA-like C-terminal region